MRDFYDCPEKKRIRVIVDTDAKNEADDQYAIVHQMMTPKFEIKAYIAAHFEKKHGEGKRESMKKSFEELKLLQQMMGVEDLYPVLCGADRAMEESNVFIESEGARFIVEEAMKNDDRPLYVLFQGAITDLASAYLMEPKIAERMTAVWIGGGEYPVGEWEFNISQDITAANVVFGSDIKLWQIPISAYRFVRVSMTELQYKVKPHGKIGKYLFEQMLACHMARSRDKTFTEGNPESFIYPLENYPLESWCLGDQPTVSVLLDEHQHEYEWTEAPFVTEDMFYIHGTGNRPIRVYTYIDSYMTMEDFYSKLALWFPEKDREDTEIKSL